MGCTESIHISVQTADQQNAPYSTRSTGNTSQIHTDSIHEQNDEWSEPVTPSTSEDCDPSDSGLKNTVKIRDKETSSTSVGYTPFIPLPSNSVPQNTVTVKRREKETSSSVENTRRRPLPEFNEHITQSVMTDRSTITPAKIKTVCGKVPYFSYSISLQHNENPPNITYTVEVNDKLIFCDASNECLYILVKKPSNQISRTVWQVQDTIPLGGPPFNMAKFPGKNALVAITIPNINVVQLFDVESKTLRRIELPTNSSCKGIGFVNGKMLYTCNKGVILFDLSNNRYRLIDYAFKDPVSICVTSENEFLVTCKNSEGKGKSPGKRADTGEVIKMETNGKRESIQFVIKNNDIRHPVSSSIDDEGFIYICDPDQDAVHRVSGDGKYMGRFLSSLNGLDTNYIHINFLNETNTFIASEERSDLVSVYSMRY